MWVRSKSLCYKFLERVLYIAQQDVIALAKASTATLDQPAELERLLIPFALKDQVDRLIRGRGNG